MSDFKDFCVEALFPSMLFFIIMFGAILSIAFPIAWQTSKVRAETYTKVCGTDITASELFWNDERILLSLIGCAPDLKALDVEIVHK